MGTLSRQDRQWEHNVAFGRVWIFDILNASMCREILLE
jgi:hypothetical protein